MKTLLIGWRDGNVADAIMREAGESYRREWYVPSTEQMDMLRPGTIHEYIKEHGPFDEIIYTAALNELTWIEDIHYDDLSRVFGVNVFGLVEVVARHIEFFEDHHPLRVVAIVSDSARTPMRGSLLYGSSKTALTGVLRNMARELAPKAIVVGVSPGIIDETPMTEYIDATVPEFRGWTPEQAKEYEKSMIPLKRRVTKQEVAETVLFALDGPASLTGSIIEITGGK